MDFSFTPDQDALRASAREVLAKEAGPASYRAVMDGPTGTDDELWRTIAALGWTGIAIDEAQEGLGLGLIELVILQEELGRALAPVPFFSTVCRAAVLAEAVGGDPANAFLAQIASGSVRATVVTGEGLVPDAHIADRFLVVDGGAVHVVDAAKVTSTTRDSVDLTRRMSEVIVDLNGATRLGDLGDALERARDRAAVLLAAEAVGVCDAVLQASVAYVAEREQFGRKIGSYQAISHRLANMLSLIEIARSHTYHAAWCLEEGTPDASIAAASAKAAASDASRIVTGGGIQVHGGIGFTWEHDMHLYFRRGKFCELFLGSAPEWRERIASLITV